MNLQHMQQISEAALAKAREIIKAGPGAEDDVKKDISSSSGASSYNLEPVGILLQPVITPLVNLIPRVANTRGGTSAEWRIITALINAATFDPFTAEAAPSSRLSYTWAAKTAAFAELGVGDRVTWTAQDAAKDFEPDLKSKAVTNTLFALKIIQEMVTLFGRISALGSITTPTVTASNTGGTIAAPGSSYNLKVRAITGMGDGTNTRGKVSALANWTTTGTGSLIAYTTPVPGAIAYEWYNDDGASGAYTLQATTGNSSVKLTALTTSGTVLPADNSANANAYDGLLAQITANAPAANVRTLAKDTVAGLGTDFTLDDIDGLNQNVWDNAKGDPDVIIGGSSFVARMTNLWLAANGGPVSYVVPDKGSLGSLTGGYRLTGFINKITGKEQRIVTHPNMPAGTAAALTMSIPFPTGGDATGVEVEFSRGYTQVDYARVAKRDDFEVYCREVLKLKFPGGAWLLTNASSKSTT